MFSEFPLVKIPDSITKLCELQLKNSKKTFSTLYDVVEGDPFLSILVKEVFKDYLKKGGMLNMLSALGWEGFRNRLAEAYLHHMRYKKLPNSVVINEIQDVIDFEKRYDFLFSEHNSRAFLLGFYLKTAQIYLEENNQFYDYDFLFVPVEVDEILILGKSKSMMPDWLIVTVWSLFKLYGKDKTVELIKNTKGDFQTILNLIGKNDYRKIVEGLLKYGNGINDLQFFIGEKV